MAARHFRCQGKTVTDEEKNERLAAALRVMKAAVRAAIEQRYPDITIVDAKGFTEEGALHPPRHLDDGGSDHPDAQRRPEPVAGDRPPVRLPVGGVQRPRPVQEGLLVCRCRPRGPPAGGPPYRGRGSSPPIQAAPARGLPPGARVRGIGVAVITSTSGTASPTSPRTRRSPRTPSFGSPPSPRPSPRSRCCSCGSRGWWTSTRRPTTTCVPTG